MQNTKNPSKPSEPRNRYRLTKLGEQMARLPIDPKVARILIAAQKHDCMAEILIIVAALSIQDPRERPLEAREAANKAHERFTDKQSDFLAYLNIWDSFQRERDRGLSNKQLVQWCHQYFLSHLRMREWRELHKQLADIAVEMGLTTKDKAFRQPPVQAQLQASAPQQDQDLPAKLKQKQLDKKQHRAGIRAAKEAGYEQIHRALLTGLIAHVGMKSPDGHDYTGARGSHFHLFPASALFKSKPKWVMAAELTETTRLYARDVAEIKPEWIEQEAPHLVRYHYFEPHWEQKRGEVVASERVTLYGLTVLPRRPVAYGKVAPEEAREIFIRGALVAQECDLKADFFVHNKKLIKEISELEHKSRRQDVLVDDEILFEFYNQRLPENVLPERRVGIPAHQTARTPAPRYADGTPIRAGDLVRVEQTWHGRIVALFAQGEYAADFPSEDWNSLKTGIMAEFAEAGLVHYEDAALWAELTFVARGKDNISRVGVNPPLGAPAELEAPLPDYCRTKIRITDHAGLRTQLCRQIVAASQSYLADWAVRCVIRILPLITDKHHQSAIEQSFSVLRRWQSGEANVKDIRQAAFELHRMAKAADNPLSVAILRAAGQAVSIGHMKEHAPVCTDYIIKAVNLAANNDLHAVRNERLQQIAELEKSAASAGNNQNTGTGYLKATVANAENNSRVDVNPPPGSSMEHGVLTPTLPKAEQYGKSLPLADIRTFQTWLKTAERSNPRLLFLSKEDLMQHAAAHITEEQFPPHWKNADGKFKLSYRFEPHHPLDGVTLTLPLTVLNRLHAPALEWLVPGMLREKLQLLIKALPKQIRRICVPVPDFITQFLESNPNRQEPIIPQLARFIAKTAGDMRLLEQIDQDEWSAFKLPEHCYFNLRIIDDGGQELAIGRDLAKLQQELGQAAAVTFRDNTQEFERDNLTNWDIGTLPESIKFARGKQQLTGYLGLQKEKNGSIALRLFDTPEAAQAAHRRGVIALMALQLKEQMKDLNKGIQGFTQAAMLLKHIGADTLRDDLTAAICDRAFIGDDDLPRSEKAFKEQIKRARSRLPAVKEAVSRYLQDTAAAYAELNGKLGKHPLTPLLRARLNTLLSADFASRTPWPQWPRLPVYIKAMTLRMEKYGSNPARDQAREADIQELENMWQDKTDALIKQGQPVSDGLAGFRWQIEELRVSLFAQELKTPYPVSVKRLIKEWEGLNKG